MICRLCLNNPDGVLEIFRENGEIVEKEVVNIVEQHFQIQIQFTDIVSNKICLACWHYLNEFQKFWLNIKEKQQTLETDFDCTRINSEEYVTADNEYGQTNSAFGDKTILMCEPELNIDDIKAESVLSAQADFDDVGMNDDSTMPSLKESEDEDEIESFDSDINGSVEVGSKSKQGRPHRERNGLRGWPKKVYNTDEMVQANELQVVERHPITAEEAMNRKNAERWKKAKDKEVTRSDLLQSQTRMYDGVMAALGRVESKVDRIEKALAEKMPEREEIMVQGRLLRECKVVASEVHQSISRITGDSITEENTLLQSKLPLASRESLNTVEDLLRKKAYHDAMLNIILKLKGTEGCVKHVLRSIFSDTLLFFYNYHGKANKAPLLGLKTIEIVFDAFGSIPKVDLIAEIKKHVFLSHNRHKQIAIKKRAKHNKTIKNK